jgi:hypothetical protein
MEAKESHSGGLLLRYWWEIVGGILIFLSSVVGEQFPKKWKLRLYSIFAVLSIAYVFTGIWLDKQADRRETELINSITGGDSYVYFEPSEPSDLPGGIAYSTFFRKFSGRHPIQAFRVTIDSLEAGMVFDHDYGTVAPQDLGIPIVMPQITFKTSNPKQTFIVNMRKSTGSYQERIRFQKSGDHWFRAYEVTLPDGSVACHWEQTGFPLVNDRVQW